MRMANVWEKPCLSGELTQNVHVCNNSLEHSLRHSCPCDLAQLPAVHLLVDAMS